MIYKQSQPHSIGRKVSVLIKDEMVQPGSYELQFNASALASGVYTYSLQANDYSSAKKMMVIK